MSGVSAAIEELPKRLKLVAFAFNASGSIRFRLMLRDDFPECPQCFVNRFGIGKHSGDIVIQFNEYGKIVKSVGIFAADAVAEVVFVQHIRACCSTFSFFIVAPLREYEDTPLSMPQKATACQIKITERLFSRF